MKKVALLIALLAVVLNTSGKGNTEEIILKSSIVCEMCKETIEKGLAYTSGIKVVRVDVEKNEIYIKYNSSKITLEKIKDEINEMGYVAGDQKPTRKEYEGLHHCCKKEGVFDD
ncbi:MAG TPA: cation transporter [Cryomorphaceae bacterium]|nr:cation transporter [Cryomorphaceae bacterium]